MNSDAVTHLPVYLDAAAIRTPSVALACAARETLRMGDVIEAMLKQAMTALSNNDRKLASEVSRMDNIVDRLDEAIKIYITKLTRESLDDREGARAMEIVAFAINRTRRRYYRQESDGARSHKDQAQIRVL